MPAPLSSLRYRVPLEAYIRCASSEELFQIRVVWFNPELFMRGLVIIPSPGTDEDAHKQMIARCYNRYHFLHPNLAGYTALHDAMSGYDVSKVRELLRSGVDPN